MFENRTLAGTTAKSSSTYLALFSQAKLDNLLSNFVQNLLLKAMEAQKAIGLSS